MAALNTGFGPPLGAPSAGSAPGLTPPQGLLPGGVPPSTDSSGFGNNLRAYQALVNSQRFTPQEMDVLRQAGIDPATLNAELSRVGQVPSDKSVGPPSSGDVVHDPGPLLAAVQQGRMTLSPGMIDQLQKLQQFPLGSPLDAVFSQQRQALKGAQRDEMKTTLAQAFALDPSTSPYEIEQLFKTTHPGGDLTIRDIREILGELGHPLHWWGRIVWQVSNFFRRLFGVSNANAQALPPPYSATDPNPPQPYTP